MVVVKDAAVIAENAVGKRAEGMEDKSDQAGKTDQYAKPDQGGASGLGNK